MNAAQRNVYVVFSNLSVETRLKTLRFLKTFETRARRDGNLEQLTATMSAIRFVDADWYPKL